MTESFPLPWWILRHATMKKKEEAFPMIQHTTTWTLKTKFNWFNIFGVFYKWISKTFNNSYFRNVNLTKSKKNLPFYVGLFFSFKNEILSLYFLLSLHLLYGKAFPSNCCQKKIAEWLVLRVCVDLTKRLFLISFCLLGRKSLMYNKK